MEIGSRDRVNLKCVVVYADEGSSSTAVEQTIAAIKSVYAGPVQTILSKDVIDGDWMHQTALFVMPGGRDLPYCSALNGIGNENIKTFIEVIGGSFLGICAGAYFASSECIFDRNGPLEVMGTRELSLFPGAAIGPLLSSYSYNSYADVRAAPVLCASGIITPSKINLYYHGGCAFQDAHTYGDVEIIAKYENYVDTKTSEVRPVTSVPPVPCAVVSDLPIAAEKISDIVEEAVESDVSAAIILVHSRRGKAVLSGVHVEYDPHDAALTEQLLHSGNAEGFDGDILSVLQRDDDGRKALLRYLFRRLQLIE